MIADNGSRRCGHVPLTTTRASEECVAPMANCRTQRRGGDCPRAWQPASASVVPIFRSAGDLRERDWDRHAQPHRSRRTGGRAPAEVRAMKSSCACLGQATTLPVRHTVREGLIWARLSPMGGFDVLAPPGALGCSDDLRTPDWDRRSPTPGTLSTRDSISSSSTRPASARRNGLFTWYRISRDSGVTIRWPAPPSLRTPTARSDIVTTSPARDASTARASTDSRRRW